MAKHPILDVPALLTTCAAMQVSDLGCRFTFGEETTEGETAWHSSVFLPIQFVPMFEKHYKDAVERYVEAKRKQTEEKQNVVQQDLG